MQTTTPAISTGWVPTMSNVVGYFRLWWVREENSRMEKQFEKENGRAPTQDERLELMTKRISYYRRMGLR